MSTNESSPKNCNVLKGEFVASKCHYADKGDFKRLVSRFNTGQKPVDFLDKHELY